MRVEIINKKNYEPSEKLKDIVSKKINHLSKFFDDSSVVKVLLKKEKNFDNMEIAISYNGNFMRASADGENMYDLIDVVLPKIERQIYKHKTKLEKKLKESAYQKENFESEGLEEEVAKIVKVKRFKLPMLTDDDAIEEMNLLDHSFYLYNDIATKEMKILYKRKDGDYGLIIPQ